MYYQLLHCIQYQKKKLSLILLCILLVGFYSGFDMLIRAYFTFTVARAPGFAVNFLIILTSIKYPSFN